MALVLLFAGCGGADDAPTLAPVTGAVTFNGKPLVEGEIYFQPEKGRSARADIKNGAIVDVTTIARGDGAPIGALKVGVFSGKPDPEDASGMTTVSVIPTKYNDSSTSGLTCTVKAGEENKVSFELED